MLHKDADKSTPFHTVRVSKAEHDRLMAVVRAAEEIGECPVVIDWATVPKAGILAAPEQVVMNMSISWLRHGRLITALKAYEAAENRGKDGSDE